MLNKFSIFVFFFFSLSCFITFKSQSTLTNRVWLGAELDYGLIRTNELQLDINGYYIPSKKYGLGMALGAGWNFNQPNMGFYSELSFDAVRITNMFFFGVLNANLKYFPKADNSLFIAPEIGFGLFIFQLTYQPTFGLRDFTPNDMIRTNQFRFKLVFNPAKNFGSLIRTGGYLGKSFFKKFIPK